MSMLQKLFKTVLFFLLCFIFVSNVALSDLDSNTEIENSLQHLSKDIDKVLKTSTLNHASFGIQIISIDSGETIYERNSDLPLNPASNTKLITSAAALVRLTPQYRFKTSVYTNAALTKGKLEGNLYLEGGGDPLLSYDDLLALAQEVYNTGIRSVEGDILGDDSFFDGEREFSGWHDFTNAYSGKLGALSLNGNAVSLVIKPSRKTGVAPHVTMDPPTSYIHLKNKAVTRTSKNKVYASFLPPEDELQESPPEETLIIQGKVSRKSKYGVFANVNVNNPTLFTTTAFKNALERLGITIQGTVTYGVVPRRSKRIARHLSAPLATIIWASNKSSDNFVAEQLLKTLGAEELDAPGSTAKGLFVIQEFFKETLEIPPDAYVLENGSGLSRNNRLRPEQIVKLLTYMYEDFEVRSEYLASLAIAGIDGTLERRLRNTQAEGRLRAKTGAIRKVSCLSGYAVSRDNEIFAFSMMMNDYKSGGYAIKKIQNQIGLLLTEFYRSSYNARVDVSN